MQRKTGRLLPGMPTVRRGIAQFALIAAFAIMSAPASAASGAFANLDGSWTGNGTLRPGDNPAERIRCNAHYRPIGDHEINLQLRCASDSYKFDLTGRFTADDRNQISGDWTEHSRGVSGAIMGGAIGDRVQVRAESPGFVADLVLVTRGRRQSVTINSQAAGQPVKASISLSRH